MGDANRYRIVFRGEIAFGFTTTETRTKLKQLCRYDNATLDRLFSGPSATLKKDLTLEQARRYKAALDETGAVCSIEENPAKGKRPSSSTDSQLVTCPKCGKQQPSGISCIDCGIVFAKYRRMQAREQGAGPASGSPYNDSLQHPAGGPWKQAKAYFARHQEQAFILKAFLVIAGVKFFAQYFAVLLLLLLFLFPLLFLTYVAYEAAATSRPPGQVIAEHITFMPVMYAEGERKKEGVPWVTYSLVLLNVLIFYGFQRIVRPEIIANNLVFLPHTPDLINVPISLFSSMFLHANFPHLLFNMLALWAVGTVLEKRIGGKKFLAFYLLAGIAANLLFAMVHFAFLHEAAHVLGASGAIAGAMGLFAIRCYFKSMVFPLPILGFFAPFLPISLKVRLNSLVIIGLFFLSDVYAGINQLNGQSDSNIAHWAHVGGMVCGILLGLCFKLGDEAVEERHQEIGSQALVKGGDLYKGEESLRLALQQNPRNGETMLLLARMVSKFEATEEGEQLYRKGLDIVSRTRPKVAAEAFKEYYGRYLKGANPGALFRLSPYFLQRKDDEWAVRCLELLAEEKTAPAAMREKAMMQCALHRERLGQIDVALHYYRLFTELFPQSPMHAKALAKLSAS